MAKDEKGTGIPVKKGNDLGSRRAILDTLIDDMANHRPSLLDDFLEWRFPNLRRRWQGFSTIRGWTPAIDVSTGDKQMVIQVDLPGVKKDDIRVSLDGDLLTVSGERKEEKETKDKDYYFSERSEGSFYRAVRLPEGTDTNLIQASYQDGVLTVTVPTPKSEPSKKVNITVK